MHYSEITTDMKRQMCDVTHEGHHTFKEINEKIKKTPYHKQMDLFIEKSGIFCQDIDSEKIRYIPDHWEVPFAVRDKRMCQDKRDHPYPVVHFHTHPIMLPKLSQSDLLISYIYGSGTWSCVGAGDHRRKRVLCVHPTKDRELISRGKSPFMVLKEKVESAGYERLFDKKDDYSIEIKLGSDKYHNVQLTTPFLDQKEYRVKKQWIEESGFFEVAEFGCDDLLPIDTQYDTEFPINEVKEALRDTLEQIEVHNPYLFDRIGDWHTIESVYDLHDEEIEYEGKDSQIYDIQGIVQMGQCIPEIIKDKDGSHLFEVSHCILNIRDDTEDIDVNYIDISKSDITRHIYHETIVGDLVRINGAVFNDGLLMGDINNMYIMAENIINK